MSKAKATPDERRIITDLSYGDHLSINGYIKKNTSLGVTSEHFLPTVTFFVSLLRQYGPDSIMFSVDIQRAYKNFRCCPLDWPLLGIKWEDRFYVDTSLPFGSRISSQHVQRVARAIVYILECKGIDAVMYLDDLIVLSPNIEVANISFDTVIALFGELGLPLTTSKTQYPSTSVKWLGIIVDSHNLSLSVPEDKLADAIFLARDMAGKRTCTLKQLQSVIGKLVHIAKCVKSARLFISRLLDAVRGHPKMYIKVNEEMRKDINWFAEFAAQWNGISYVPSTHIHENFTVDACPTGIGGFNATKAY